MAQITHGIRRLLSFSHIYNLSQAIVGASKYRKRIVKAYLQPKPGMQVIDVGCGTGALLEQMPQYVSYVGFDLSAAYIEHAKKRFGSLGQFHCADVADAGTLGLPKADLIVAIGVLHHLDDALATNLIQHAADLLAPGGRFVAIDGCFEDGQSPIARWLLRRDRGQNVRDAAGYLSLASRANVQASIEVRHDLLRIPYTHSILECRVT